MKSNPTVAILGAGITGLSIAYALQKRGINVTVYEQRDDVGGVIKTRSSDEWLVEEGPNTMLVRDQKIWNLINELNLTNQLVTPGDEAKKRYIIRDGTLCAVPTSVWDFLTSNLLSGRAKIRLLKEPFISSAAQDDETIASFITRRLGNEPLEYTVNPFVSGIYAGDVNKLSIKHTFSSLFEAEQKHGSITKGFLKNKTKNPKTERALISFDDGLQTLPKAFKKKLGDAVHLNTKIRHCSSTKGDWDIQLESDKKTIYDAVISTIPVHQLATIWNDSTSNQPLKQLANINYAPMSVLALGFKREQVAHPLDGFGMLIPEKEPFSMLGCLFSSSLFAHRAPDNHVLLTCFMGGARNPQSAKKTTAQLTGEALSQLKHLVGASGQPQFHHHTYWKQAIPQYNTGYEKYLRLMTQIELKNPGFFMAGNYRGGVSVPDCILNGIEMAKRVHGYLSD